MAKHARLFFKPYTELFKVIPLIRQQDKKVGAKAC